ncbi:50S ribosomal protein L9 [Kineosporia sp. NBRC 101731]|uniref:50S ribosomal protein L9 n=1 Tax=Kineosporia sp. NBRC 101731 TaxID=3032199 RepID=UPI0024A2EA39|nr:50S ribosomal protein L9 [Kineosporia sp. NBRC 101731]GLY26906.1 50S ribosomal protein L9 [Kineosporia sp. NBRC 101731]
MKLILTQEVSGLGTPGDVVEVKDGYGRNFLVPRGLATVWTKGGEKQVSAIRKARKTREIATLEEANSVKAKLESKPVRLAVRAGASGRLFGAITPSDIAAAIVEAQGPQVDRRKVEIPSAIKTTGEHIARVRLHADVQAKVTLKVVAEG